MQRMHDLQELYSELGGQFIQPITHIAEKLPEIKAFIYDWDGVFNDGTKGQQIGSSYKEADSMGTNLLRFAHWLSKGETLPKFGIITGAKNETALQLANREHFDCVYLGTADKAKALEHFCKTYAVEPDEIAFFFDDVLDLPIAEKAGLRFQIKRTSSPLFSKYVEEKQFVDYLTANEGNHFAVRETAELLMAIYGKYDEVLSLRMQFEGAYQNYLNARNSGATMVFTPDNM